MNPESNLNQSTDNGLQTTAATSVVTKPNNTVIILFSILILILLASTGFLYYQNQQLKTMLARYQQTQAFPTPTPYPDPTANWKTYTITAEPVFGILNYQIKIPASWKQIEHSSNFQNAETFQDSYENVTYKLRIIEQKNINQQTGKPYETLRELSGFPYDVTHVTVAGQEAAQVLPRAGGESYFMVVFFSPYQKQTVSIELETPRDGSKFNEGQTLFFQILSTFKFLGQPASACRPRPACLDSTPRCLIPETEDMCPYSCPANGYANCQPGPDKNRTCSADAMAWYKANCPDFKGGAM